MEVFLERHTLFRGVRIRQQFWQKTEYILKMKRGQKSQEGHFQSYVKNKNGPAREGKQSRGPKTGNPQGRRKGWLLPPSFAVYPKGYQSVNHDNK